MSIDDLPRKAAEQMERGHNPSTSVWVTEQEAAEKITRWLTPLPDEPARVAGRIVAGRAWLSTVFTEITADAARLRLQQQQYAEADDPTWWGEHVHHLRRELADAEAIYARVLARHAPVHDPDVRGADEDDRRLSQERRDFEAAAGMPQDAA